MSSYYYNSFDNTSRFIRKSIDQMSRLATILPFSQVRAYYELVCTPDIIDGFGRQDRSKVGLPAGPTKEYIRKIWHDVIGIKKPDSLEDGGFFIEAHSFDLPPHREEHYLQLTMSEMAKIDHPYDKVGAFLKVFKLMRDEYFSGSKEPLATRHTALRYYMTNLLTSFSAVALAQHENEIIHDGYGRLLQNAYRHPAARPAVEQRVEGINIRYNADDFFVLSPGYYEDWKNNKHAIIAQRRRLGAILKDMPAEGLHLFRLLYGRYTGLTEYPRRPPPWFVLQHYLATHSHITWNRAFFVDALLRKEHPRHQNDYDVPEDERQLELQGMLKPQMNDDAFQSRWADAERRAWRDYRRVRELLFQHHKDTAFPRFIQPSQSQLKTVLTQNVFSVFNDPIERVPINDTARVLDRVVPGLGSRFITIKNSADLLSLSMDQQKDMYCQAIHDLKNPPPDNEQRLPNNLCDFS